MRQPKADGPTHLAYSDETHYNVGRYRGIGLVTAPRENASTLSVELEGLLKESGVAEFKWKKFAGAKERCAARKILNSALGRVLEGTLRVDGLIWDTQDSRHQIRGRDDIANLQRMYYHLFKHVLRERWPDGSTWQLFPDENSALDWEKVGGFLDLASIEVEVDRSLFSKNRFSLRLKREFSMQEITPRKSHGEPLVQLADLFVGLMVYSREQYDRYEKWQRTTTGQNALFGDGNNASVQLSRSDRERRAVLSWFDAMCKHHRLGVSLKTDRGLRTRDPKNPINFWWYEPQHEKDKAPVRTVRAAVTKLREGAS